MSKLKWSRIMGWSIVFLFLLLIGTVRADFPKLDEAIPGDFVRDLAPVFDFTDDSCLPSAGISRSGVQNGGLDNSGDITGQCRSDNFLDTSNTLHRYACASQNGSIYCGHSYALYFEKDHFKFCLGPLPWDPCFDGGHRHDWENVIVWTKDNVITHASVSQHGEFETKAKDELSYDEDGHVKVVYFHDEEVPLTGIGTHALKFAHYENAGNPYDRFVTPTLASWYNLTGDGVDNATMRANLNIFNYGDANLPVKNSRFWRELNTNRPLDYPYFPAQTISLTDSPDPLRVGELLEYTATITNNGPDVPAKVEFVLANGLIFVDGTDGCLETSENIVSCDLGMLLADETRKIIVNTKGTQRAASTIVTSAKAIIEADDSANLVNIVDDETTRVIQVVYLPLSVKNPGPELIITDIDIETNGVVTVKIRNDGTSATTYPFWIDLCFEPDPVPQQVNDICLDGRSKYGLVWHIDPYVQPGESITLTIGDPNFRPHLSRIPGSMPGGTPVYVQVDSANTETSFGGVHEMHEVTGSGLPYNNIVSIVLEEDVIFETAASLLNQSEGINDTELPARPE